MQENVCKECGSPLPGGIECREYLNEMIKWDFEDFLGVGQIHHLTVLCYNLQHPSVYSHKGLEDAKNFLTEFVTTDVSFAEHDKRNRERLSSAVRDWKITGSDEDRGSYDTNPEWDIIAYDVVMAGLENYVDNVKAWAQSVYDVLKESGNVE